MESAAPPLRGADNGWREVSPAFLARLLALFAAYLACACIGLRWSLFGGAGSPVWPAAGVGLAGLLLGGVELWPAIVAARLVAALATGSDQPFWVELAIGLGNAAGAALPVLLVRRLGGVDPRLSSLADLVRYLVPGALGGALVAAMAGTLAIGLASGLDAAAAAHLFRDWATARFVGAVTAGPLILSWSGGWRRLTLPQAAALATILLVTGALAAAVFGAGGPQPLQIWHLLPVLVLLALAFDVRGASAGLVLVSAIAVWKTSLGLGPFAQAPLPALPMLQQYLAVMAMTILLLAATADERRARDTLLERERQLAAAEERARARAEELEAVLGAVPAVIFVAHDPQCREIVGNPFAATLLRLPDPASNMSKSAEEEAAVSHFRVLDRDGRELAPEELPVQRAARGEVVRDFEERVVFDDGTAYDLLGAATPLREPSGKLRGAVAVFIDITERKAAEERARLLAREVDHRAKNIMAVVQAVVQLTRAEDLAGFRTAVLGRIGSLARTHSLLAVSQWHGTELRALIEAELAPYVSGPDEGAARVRLEGPAVTLLPATTQSVALAIHELATNAAKYGSLAVPEGRLDIAWRLENAPDGQRLHLDWSERDGPAVAPPERSGFGLTLIRSTIEGQLQGQMSASWQSGGLALAMAFRIGDAGAEDQAGAGSGGRPASGKPLVLVLDDEPLIAMQMELELEEAGYEVLGPAASEAEALELVAKWRPDAAILDVNLGGGRKSTKVAEWLAAEAIPFACCTGYADMAGLPPPMQAARRLAKPAAPGELKATVAALLAP